MPGRWSGVSHGPFGLMGSGAGLGTATIAVMACGFQGLRKSFIPFSGAKVFAEPESCHQSLQRVGLWLTRCSAAADMRKGAPVHDPEASDLPAPG
jgi:hypothetical protein